MPNPDEKDIEDETAELVERLRALARCDPDDLSVAEEAAAEIERLRARVAELEKARDGMQNALADAIKDAISDLDDHAGDDLPTRRFLAGAIDVLKKALFIAVSASPVPQNGEGE